MSEKPAWLKSAADVRKERNTSTSDVAQAANENLPYERGVGRVSQQPFLPKEVLGTDALRSVAELERVIEEVIKKKPQGPVRRRVQVDYDVEASVGAWTLEEVKNYLLGPNAWGNPGLVESLIVYARGRIEDVRKIYS